MAERSLADQLNDVLDEMLAHPGAVVSSFDPELTALLDVASDLRDLPRAGFHAQLKSDLQKRASFMNNARKEKEDVMAAKAVEGYQTVTPYITVREPDAIIEFVKKAFDGKELYRGTGSAGGVHCEVRIGDSILMIGGGGAWKGTAMPGAIHLYVTDVDAFYERALRAGASSLMGPTDQVYGDRDAAIKDIAGNHWYIGTHKGTTPVPEGMRTATSYLHPKGAAGLIDFMQRAFGAKELDRHQTPQGVVMHAKVSIGDSVIEMGEAHGEWQPMPMTLFLYVNDVDALYAQALRAGASSISEPADQSYGARVAGVKDDYGNVWYLATPKS